MEECYFSRKHEIGRLVGCAISSFPSIGLILIGIYSFTVKDGTPMPFIVTSGTLLIGSGIAWGVFLVLYTIWMIREYELDERGIWIRYTSKRTDFFPWSSVTQICLCKAHHGKEESTIDDVIWVSVGKVKACPPNTPWYRDLFEYEYCHKHSIITVEFTPERLERFKKYYKQEIPDYRNMNCY